jgi:N6-L-threonylcarbamoyladenine synthase
MDDAAGEAFDKTAKLLGLGYPGGPALARLADQGNPEAISLPRPMLHSGNLDFSFSGLKTAVLTRLKDAQALAVVSDTLAADLAAATQQAIVEVLVAKSIKALDQTGLKRLVVAGGVGANQLLRSKLSYALIKRKAEAFFPPLELCTDNGAMIAFAAAQRITRGMVDLTNAQHGFDVRPRWDLASI